MMRLSDAASWFGTRAVVVHVVTMTPVSASSVACSEPPSAACVCDSPPVVDTALVAFLSKVRSAHHQADLREQSGDIAGAIESIEKTVDASVGLEGLRDRPEVREVRADMFARISEIRGRLGDFDAAERDIRSGLDLSPRDSYFEGHLFEIRGVNEERRAKALAAAGHEQAAEDARKAALSAFQSAIDIQERVIRNALQRDGGDGP